MRGAWKEEVRTGKAAKQFGSTQGMKESGGESPRTTLGWDYGQVFFL